MPMPIARIGSTARNTSAILLLIFIAMNSAKTSMTGQRTAMRVHI